MGGTNNADNLIDLYAEEHYIAHKLLALEHKDNPKLTYAWWRMSQIRSKNNKDVHISEQDYAIARKMHADAMSKRVISKETRAKFSDRTKGVKNPMYGMCGEKNPFLLH